MTPFIAPKNGSVRKKDKHEVHYLLEVVFEKGILGATEFDVFLRSSKAIIDSINRRMSFHLSPRATAMFKRQSTICSLALVAALICSASAYSQSVFIAPSSDLNNLNFTTIGIGPNSSIELFAFSNSTAVDSLDLFVPVGSFFGAVSPPPPVVNISGLGIFSGASTVFTPANLSATSDAGASFSLPNSAVLTDGAPIAEVFFDTTGLSGGDSIAFGFDNSIFFNAGEEVDANGVLTNFAFVEAVPEPNGTAVPEPSSAALILALGSIVMMRRKRL